jgi:RNA polymerase sigma-70 factor (ECF subfamily)
MDEADFDALYSASFGRIVVQITAMIGSREEAKDCVQEAFVRAWGHRDRLHRDLSPESWVRTTAYRLAVSNWRRRHMDRRADDRSLVTPVPQPSPDRVALEAAMATLPADQRRALVLFHFADLPVRDIARETGVSEGTVKSRLSRARTTLSSRLSDRLPQETHHV